MNILIYGTGTMGKGIAQVFASENYQVYLYNANLKRCINAKEEIKLRLSKLSKKNKISLEDMSNTLGNIVCIDDLYEAKKISLVIETVSEDIEIKKRVLNEIDSKIDQDAIIATNTSSLSITELSREISRPDNFIGMHFFNPAPIMGLVELICGMATSDSTKTFSKEIIKTVGKRGVFVEENPGFIVNRILIPMINEAVSVLADHTANLQDIDNAMIMGANHPIGPLKLADLIGLDICLSILDTLYLETGNPKYSAHPLLRKMVRGNKLGVKTNEGFYNY